MYRLRKKRIYIRKNEIIDSLEIYEGEKRRFYSYTYMVKGKKGWVPSVRWDNFQQQPHIDRYDESGALLEQKNSPEKELEAVEHLVKIFRRNLVAMSLEDF